MPKKYFAWLLLFSTGLMAEPKKYIDQMNGIDFAKYRGFEERWKLVTSRFRTDNFETRLVYANDLAWKTLSAGRTDYPDGAAFGKIALLSNEDPRFESSVQPVRQTRVQLMVKNTKRYPDSDGWGYAIYSPAGEAGMLSKDIEVTVQSCHACHEAVADRGFVFSNPMPTSTRKGGKIAIQVVSEKSGIPFSSKVASDLPAVLQAKFRSTTLPIRFLEGKLRKYTFAGTLSELRPFLIAEAKKSGISSVYVSEDQKRFVAILTQEAAVAQGSCHPGVKPLFIYASSIHFGTSPAGTVEESWLCASGQRP